MIFNRTEKVLICGLSTGTVEIRRVCDLQILRSFDVSVGNAIRSLSFTGGNCCGSSYIASVLFFSQTINIS
jgi:hypothetical protein